MVCSNCGAELKDNQKFCIKCGTQINWAVGPAANSVAPQPVANDRIVIRQTVEFSRKQLLRELDRRLLGVFAVLLIVNLMMIFIPCVEIYMPSQRETNLWTGKTEYTGWHTSSYSVATLIFPVVFTAVPYVISAILLALQWKRDMVRLNKNTGPFWAEFAAIANIVMVFLVYGICVIDAGNYKSEGATCSLTFGGVLNLVFTVAIIIVAGSLSKKLKAIRSQAIPA